MAARGWEGEIRDSDASPDVVPVRGLPAKANQGPFNPQNQPRVPRGADRCRGEGEIGAPLRRPREAAGSDLNQAARHTDAAGYSRNDETHLRPRGRSRCQRFRRRTRPGARQRPDHCEHAANKVWPGTVSESSVWTPL
jgi:hypothetical protein